jgi:hypothetical protein
VQESPTKDFNPLTSREHVRLKISKQFNCSVGRLQADEIESPVKTEFASCRSCSFICEGSSYGLWGKP